MSKSDLHNQILHQLHETYLTKNADYGDSFSNLYREFGIITSVIRIKDKFNRFAQLTKNEQSVKDESIKDTLLDLANYAIMTVIEMETNQDKVLRLKDTKEYTEKELIEELKQLKVQPIDFGELIESTKLLRGDL